MPANYQELVQDVVELVGRQRIRPKVLGWIRMAEETAVQRIRELREVIYIFSGTSSLSLLGSPASRVCRSTRTRSVS